MTQGDEPSTARGELKRGWPLLIATAAGASLAPLTVYTLGLFVEPLQAEFGWSRGFISSALTIYAFVSVLLAGPVGYIIDVFGPRRVALPGMVFFCLAIAALALTTQSQMSWWGLWFLVACGAILVKPTVWTAAIIGRFDSARGIALALTLCGGSITAMLGPLVAERLIADHGWRNGYIGLAVIWGAVCMPIVWALFYSRNDLERAQGRTPPQRTQVDKVALAKAVRSAPFLKLALACFLLVFTASGASVHLVPLLSNAGIDRTTAASLAGLVGLAAFLGRLTSGSLLDRVDARIVATIVSALPAVAFAGLTVFDGDVVFAGIFAFVLGLCAGAEFEIAAYLSSRFFKGASFGTLFGLVNGMITLGAGLGSMVYGLAFDAAGTYSYALLVAIPLTLVASALVWSLGPTPRASTGPEPEPDQPALA